MLTDAEISRLWQFAHLKFHFGEKLASNVMFFPTPIEEHGAATAGAVAENSVPQESMKESVDLVMLTSSKRDGEDIS